jgi:hypothetical protein
MAAALGFRFLDAEYRELEPTLERLPELASIESLTDALPPVQVSVACDVKNRCSDRVAPIRVYGSQKGLRDEAQAERAWGAAQGLIQHTVRKETIVNRRLLSSARIFWYDSQSAWFVATNIGWMTLATISLIRVWPSRWKGRAVGREVSVKW